MIRFLLTRDVHDPERRKGDAGIDLFIPAFSDELERLISEMNGDSCILNKTGIFVLPHNIVKIPLGIKSSFDNNLAMVIMNRSSVATQKGLDVMACVIDSSYQGEWVLSMCNTSGSIVSIKYGSKITQVLPLYIDNEVFCIVNGLSDKAFFGQTTERGDGGFGSTDKLS